MIRLNSTRLLSLVNSQNGCETQATGIARTTTAAPGLMEEHVISSATTTTICAAPAAGTTNELDHVTIKNTYAGANTVEVKIVGAVTTHSAYAVLQQNESLEFTHAQGWRTFDSSGQEKITVGGTGGNFAVGGNLTVAGTATVTGASSVAALTASGLITASAGLTVASVQTLTLTGATVAGAPTWSSGQTMPGLTLSDVLTVTKASGLSVFKSGNAANYTAILLGRTGAEGGMWISGGTGQIISTDAAGDIDFTINAANKFNFGSSAGASWGTWSATGFSVTGTLVVSSLGAFASSDKYVVVDSSGNFHKSALGPLS